MKLVIFTDKHSKEELKALDKLYAEILSPNQSFCRYGEGSFAVFVHLDERGVPHTVTYSSVAWAEANLTENSDKYVKVIPEFEKVLVAVIPPQPPQYVAAHGRRYKLVKDCSS